MDLEIEGFSATQRTIIDPAMRAVEISASNRRGNEVDKPQALADSLYPSVLCHDSGQWYRLCGLIQSIIA